MDIFLIVLGFISLLGLIATAGIVVTPSLIAQIKTFRIKIKTAIEDAKFDISKKSEERRKRDEIKRAKMNELAQKRLDSKLQKLDKQAELINAKKKLADEFKQNQPVAPVVETEIVQPIVVEAPVVEQAEQSVAQEDKE